MDKILDLEEELIDLFNKQDFTCKLRDVLKKQKIEIRVGDFAEKKKSIFPTGVLCVNIHS